MIRHLPLGSGHPYADDTEQRSPTLPVAGEPLRIGARASADVTKVVAHLTQTLGDGSTLDVELVCAPVERSSRGRNVDGGHLAAAQARKNASAGGWEHMIDVSPDAVRLAYRFEAHGERTQRTRTFETDVAAWHRAPDACVELHGRAPVPVVAGSVRVLRTAARIARVAFSLPLEPTERVVGFGERYDRLDQRGASLDSQVFEQYKDQGAKRRTYLPMPFAHVVGGAGWGFHVATSRRVWFDVGENDAERIVIEALVDAPADAASVVRVHTYAGTPAEVLDQYVGEVGRPEELPAWVFGLWASGNEWNTQAEVERQLALHREHAIPVRTVVIEAWSDEATFTAWRDASYEPREDGGPLRLEDFTFPPDGAWPDPAGMIDAMHADGVRLLLWQIPLIKMRPHPKGQAAADARAAIAEGRVIRETAPDGSLRPYRNRGWWFPLSLMPDLTDDDAARWWTDKRRYLVEQLGVDGFKTDGGEHAWGDDLVYLDGARGDERNNVFPRAYAKAYGDLLRRAGKAPVTFSRAGFTGSQAHGTFWAGDENSTWDAFRWSMWAGLNAAASGIVYWGWDIAGFSGPVPDAELYVRSFAAGAFVPIMQYHSEFNHHRSPPRDRTPWNVADQTGDATVIDEVREIVELRDRLLPYLEEQAKRAVATSRPLMRPLFFDHPDDPAAWAQDPQWTLGDDVLVAPVLAPGRDWDVHLPAGSWRCAWTAAEIDGGAVVATSTPRQRVPVFVRDEAWPRLQGVFRPPAG